MSSSSSSKLLWLLLSRALLVVVLAALAALAALMYQDCISPSDLAPSGSHAGYARIPFDKDWDSEVSARPLRIVAFAPSPQRARLGELFALFAPATMLQTLGGRTPISVVGVATPVGERRVVSLLGGGVTLSDWYRWVCGARDGAGRTPLGAGQFVWHSLYNQQSLLAAGGLGALLRQRLDPLFAPVDPVRTWLGARRIRGLHDVLLLTHRAPRHALPYFVHFHTRRVLCAAVGAVRVTYASSMSAALRGVPREACAFPQVPPHEEEGACGSFSWTLSPFCSLTQSTNSTFFSRVVPQGQCLVVPPGVVYLLEHATETSSSSSVFSHACVVLQSDYSTHANVWKNRVFFRGFDDLSAVPTEVSEFVAREARGGTAGVPEDFLRMRSDTVARRDQEDAEQAQELQPQTAEEQAKGEGEGEGEEEEQLPDYL